MDSAASFTSKGKKLLEIAFVIQNKQATFGKISQTKANIKESFVPMSLNFGFYPFPLIFIYFIKNNKN